VEEEDLDAAILKFSDSRVTEIASEFSHQYGGLDRITRKFLKWPKEFPVDRLKEITEEVWLEIECGDDASKEYTWVGGYTEDPRGFARTLLECGILLYKSNRTAEPAKYDLDKRPVITGDTWVAVHPAFWPALGM